jgi:dihydrofolate synthase/folylpolyglutamate synthase
MLDGAHNTEGLEGLARAMDEEFPRGKWALVVGMRGERSPDELLVPLVGRIGSVVATAPEDTQAIPASAIADASRRVFGAEIPVTAVMGVTEALQAAMEDVGEDGRVVVTGSLYVVGEARRHLLPRGMAVTTGVHVRIEAVVDDVELAEDHVDLVDDDDDEFFEAEDYGSDLQ